jgi:hypothetical protein
MRCLWRPKIRPPACPSFVIQATFLVIRRIRKRKFTASTPVYTINHKRGQGVGPRHVATLCDSWQLLGSGNSAQLCMASLLW